MNNFTRPFFTTILLCLLQAGTSFAQDVPPHVTATGNQAYCPGTPMNIVTAFNITDPDDTGTDAIYIQISEGYANGEDMLSLPPGHPNIIATWNALTGKLALLGIGGDVPYTDLIAAVEDVIYTNTSEIPSGTRNFSITVGEANYLPSTGHYYTFIPQAGITWTSAKAAAEAGNYYGLQGYLATLTSAEEAQIAGEQASGNGWIGASDAEAEGTWKWVTGPEAGTILWIGAAWGSSPTFAFWNTGEPNNAGDENYAHVTAPGVGIPGSWNDLPNGGSAPPYAPQGYIVEYGGMPGDPVLHISASTTISFPGILSGDWDASCGPGALTLEATASDGATVYWYNSETGGTEIATGETYTTPVLTETTIYYASAYDSSCPTAPRRAVTAYIYPVVTIATATPVISTCYGTTVTLEVTSSEDATVFWYESPSNTPIGTGNIIQSPVITANSSFFAVATFTQCTSTAQVNIDVTLEPQPQPGPDENVVFCEGGETDLDAGITGVTYLWSTEEISQTITIGEPGTYTVEVTNSAGCTAIKTFTATTLTAPEITDVIVKVNKAIIMMANNGTDGYRYAIDGLPYQDSNIFTGLTNGYHTVSALSRNGCGEAIYTFPVYVISKFFTPNGDTINDLFFVDGFPEATTNIFDRYGKLITQLNRKNRSWDGTHNGNPMPATDYWYVIKIDDFTPEVWGHFTLMR